MPRCTLPRYYVSAQTAIVCRSQNGRLIGGNDSTTVSANMEVCDPL
jgi:hypothetical protein